MNLPLWLVPRASRTVRMQRRRAGALVGPLLDLPSTPADVAHAVNMAAQPLHELRIWGTARALRRIGAEPTRDIRGPFWNLWISSAADRAVGTWVTCYEGEPS
jgi:hypothetical protein